MIGSTGEVVSVVFNSQKWWVKNYLSDSVTEC